jgi:hypothetical protein
MPQAECRNRLGGAPRFVAVNTGRLSFFYRAKGAAARAGVSKY